jgi:hypothetical protein
MTLGDDTNDFVHELGLRRVQIFRPTPVFWWAVGWYEHHFDTPYV